MKAHYHIEKINNDNRRPGMPQDGYLVRYDISDYGWKCTHVCSGESEAEGFAATLTEDKQCTK